jgi:hypothetical protein
MKTLNVPLKDNQLVWDNSWKIISTNKLEDNEFIINTFKELEDKKLI